MSTTALDTVVVAGGSMAGLLAAAAVRPYAQRVVVLERDHVPDEPHARPGTPQAPHTHGVLSSGRAAMEQLLPGLTDQLVDAGAVSGADIGSAGRWWVGGGLIAQCETGDRGLAVSRPLLEHTIRARVAELPEIELREAADVAHLAAEGGRVTGVMVRDRDGDGSEDAIPADLVIDATGRSGRAARWLPDIGASAPVEERIEVGIRYVTVHVKARDDDLDGLAFVVSAATPDVPKGGVAIRQEDGTWTLTLFGYGDVPPPLDTDGLRQLADLVVAPELAELLRDRDPLHEPLVYRFPDCRRRHFERLGDLPYGYAPVGDAICSVDPTFGQGMSLTAQEAVALGRAVAVGEDEVRTTYPKAAAAIVDTAWAVVQGTDLQIPGVRGTHPRGHGVVSRYVGRLQRVARRDPAVARAFLRVTNLVDPPPSLMAPPVAVRVLRPGAAG
ncbi:FAD-binding protein [Mumia zhuanghuii]|uniref:NAD(P)/FAD-dependent oxidoreductase n=2 Tax=Mumia TaxID=1546255 RepID=A0ABW1QRR4_9ACTN|nr:MULTISPECIES: FAD-binding protein [Mumia]KAA1423722.1 FAD-binding protein [Mumia zhuanghuii]